MCGCVCARLKDNVCPREDDKESVQESSCKCETDRQFCKGEEKSFEHYYAQLLKQTVRQGGFLATPLG